LFINVASPPSPWVTRFAPSPTGYLHLGHILSMAFVYGISNALGAKLLLRIEDHDQGRSRPGFEKAIFEDLAWFGFQFDEEPLFQTQSLLRQSDQLDRYEYLLSQLEGKNLIYPCDCSRAKIHQVMREQPIADSFELRYPGTCRNRRPTEFHRNFGKRFIVNSNDVRFNDAIHGEQIQSPHQQCGDFLVRDRHGHFTYQFAVVADDLDQGVNLIIRGNDLLHATGRQIMLGEALDRTTPIQFIHHPLLTDESGKKLGKRFFSEAVAKRRANGERPEDLLGEALFLAGISRSQVSLQPAELKDIFTIRTSGDHS